MYTKFIKCLAIKKFLVQYPQSLLLLHNSQKIIPISKCLQNEQNYCYRMYGRCWFTYLNTKY